MKKLIFLMGIFGMSLLHAQNNIPEAQKGVEYGAGVPENITYNVQSPDQVIKSLKKKNEIDRVIIKGRVTAVCPKKGCWVTLENSQNVEVFVKMKDYFQEQAGVYSYIIGLVLLCLGFLLTLFVKKKNKDI